MRNEGPNNVQFKDGQKVTFYHPTTKLGGMLFGDRLIHMEGSLIFEDPKNQLKAVIVFKTSRFDDFTGLLYQSKVRKKSSGKDP
mmetsp:Transcript_12173/g.12013  ORF Transcript_12173/g.12013 Transcript_12173/m.12013 type:complete len:84 (+) Transcript_12173:644-895(+)